VERVLEQRAISVNLHPEIEDSCREFLVQNCGQATGNGEEIRCLQVGGIQTLIVKNFNNGRTEPCRVFFLYNQ